MKKILTAIITLSVLIFLAACSNNSNETPAPSQETQSYTIGICNYVDDASLNQIVENINERLSELTANEEVKLEVLYDNANADANVLRQIISNFLSKNVDLMVGIATPVAIDMQMMTEDNQAPVIFAAVSDPLSAGLVDSLETPGHNISGTSDFLNTGAIMNLILAKDPDVKKVGLLYDVGQDSSANPIKEAKAFFESKGIEYVEKTGTNVDEIKLAVNSLIAEGVEVIFTPTDNTVMTAELSIYEEIADAGILHYTGADSFALNGAFLGYGVDYANLGRETADMVYEVLYKNADISTLSVKTFDNGTATINEDIIAKLGLDLETLKTAFG
ncbi:MAG: ABC transporter substrate-binding protein, partial [Erysipelotrichaceae bacterium]|nr:ABC transporter substrate-binding protein [Erysipelotrichaceae bacterium]